MTESSLYRFNERVAVNPPSGPTFYLTEKQARQMARAYAIAKDIRATPFAKSTVPTICIQAEEAAP